MEKIGPCVLQGERHSGKGSGLKVNQDSFIAPAVELLYDP